MKRISRILGCLTSRQSILSYYRGLSSDQLLKRRKSLYIQYLTPVVIWGTTILLMAGAFQVETELVILYSTTAGGTMIMLFDDYRRRKQLIERILAERTH